MSELQPQTRVAVAGAVFTDDVDDMKGLIKTAGEREREREREREMTMVIIIISKGAPTEEANGSENVQYVSICCALRAFGCHINICATEEIQIS